MNQIDKTEWTEVLNCLYLCTIPFSVKNLESNFGLEFEEVEEQGLGVCFVCFVEISGTKLFLKGYIDKESKELGIQVNTLSFEPDPEGALNKVCDIFDLSQQELEATKELIKPRWAVLRLDDNNNEVEMYRFRDEEAAKYYLSKFEGNGHKQSYFIQEV